MVSCSVSRCKNNSGKLSKDKDGITFHRFPRDVSRRKQWELALHRDETWCSTPSSTVCSEHFDVKDFYLTESGLRRLSLYAVPSVNISPSQSDQTIMPLLESLDIKATDSFEVIQLKHKVKRLEVIAENRRKRLNLMWQVKRRLKKKVYRMKCLIKHLIKVKKANNQNR